RRPGSQEKKTWRRGEKKPGRNNQPPLTRRERDFGMSRFLRAVHCKYTPVAGACGRAENGSTGLLDVSNYPADSSSTKKCLRHGHAQCKMACPLYPKSDTQCHFGSNGNLGSNSRASFNRWASMSLAT